MILTCQKCSTSFRLDETLLEATGSKVRCSLCQNIWVAFPPESSLGSQSAAADGDVSPGGAALAVTGAAAGVLSAGMEEIGDDAVDTPREAPPELKFFADEEFEESPNDDDDLVTDEINLDELDQLLSEEAGPASRPVPDEDFKTEELNLADLEKMLDIEADQKQIERAAEPAEPEDLELGETPPGEISAADKEDSVIEELDLDLEDLESLLEEDTGLGDEIAAAEETAAGHKAETEHGLSQDAEAAGNEIELDLDSDLEKLLEDESRAPVIEETEEIGVSEMADALEAPETSPADDAADDQDLDFELAPGLDGIFDEGDDKDIPIEETEELDFSELETDLAVSKEDQTDEAPELELDLGGEMPSDQVQDLEGLGDLELSLEEDDIPDEPSDHLSMPRLDLSDLSQALDEGDTEAAKVEKAAEPPELELELDLDDDGGGEAEALELAMENLDQPMPRKATPAAGDIAEETRELDIDELESLLEVSEETSDTDEEQSSDSLELDIDLDNLDESEEDGMEDATRELDLNDIEKILEMEGAEESAGSETAAASEDIDLDLDMETVAPPAAEAEDRREETTDADAALDLSELEKMLEVEDTTDSPMTTDEEMDDLDLDFELQPSTEASDDLDLEFDMLDEEEPAEASALFDTSESEDLGLDLESGGAETSGAEDFETDLDFEIMDEDLAVEEVDLDLDAEDIGATTLSEPVAVVASGAAGASRGNRDLTQELMDEMAAADTQTMAAPPIETKPIKPAPPPMKRKKKSSKSLILLFILVLLGGAGYLLPKYTDIKIPAIKLPDLSGIPIIGEYFGSSSSEAIVPVEASLKGDWIQNQQAGRLYMIQGRVKNEYQSPRSFIRVTGRVYANGRQFQRAAKAYCGNLLTADELATLPLAEIQQKLSNRSGSDNSNVKVAPGQEVPFMVVFGDLPPEVELQEFAVEISGSLPVTAK
jgi:predicted Zn finger-like uncharacterized protein